MREIYRGQIALCKMEIILMDITLFAEQLTRTFEVLVLKSKYSDIL